MHASLFGLEEFGGDSCAKADDPSTDVETFTLKLGEWRLLGSTSPENLSKQGLTGAAANTARATDRANSMYQGLTGLKVSLIRINFYVKVAKAAECTLHSKSWTQSGNCVLLDRRVVIKLPAPAPCSLLPPPLQQLLPNSSS